MKSSLFKQSYYVFCAFLFVPRQIESQWDCLLPQFWLHPFSLLHGMLFYGKPSVSLYRLTKQFRVELYTLLLVVLPKHSSLHTFCLVSNAQLHSSTEPRSGKKTKSPKLSIFKHTAIGAGAPELPINFGKSQKYKSFLQHHSWFAQPEPWFVLLGSLAVLLHKRATKQCINLNVMGNVLKYKKLPGCSPKSKRHKRIWKMLC